MLISHRLHLARLVPGHDVGLSLNQLLRRAKIRPRDVKLDQPDWSDHAHSLAFTGLGLEGRALVHAMMTAYWEPLAFELPRRTEGPHQGWHRWVDTSRDSPDDICEGPDLPPVQHATYVVQPRSLAILVARVASHPEAGASPVPR